MVSVAADLYGESCVPRLLHCADIALRLSSLADDAGLVGLSSDPHSAAGLVHVCKFSVPGCISLPVCEPMLLLVRAPSSCREPRVLHQITHRAHRPPRSTCIRSQGSRHCRSLVQFAAAHAAAQHVHVKAVSRRWTCRKIQCYGPEEQTDPRWCLLSAVDAVQTATGE